MYALYEGFSFQSDRTTRYSLISELIHVVEAGVSRTLNYDKSRKLCYNEKKESGNGYTNVE